MVAVTDKDKEAEHISREAGDKQKGFRFQKLRAAVRFLESVAANKGGQVFCAIEFLEDSFVLDGAADQMLSGEENKLYSSALSFNSAAVKNTIVAFLDIFFSLQQSEELKLSIYASADTADERITGEVRDALGYSDKGKLYSILKSLVGDANLSEEEQKIAHHIVLEEYKDQYKDRKGGFLKLLEAWDFKELYTFLKQIGWSISKESNEDLETKAFELIRVSRFYNYRHERLEPFILSRLIDELEKRSGLKSPIDRLLATDTLELIFRAVLGEVQLTGSTDLRPDDPACNTWDGIDLKDFRNLEEKIMSVSPQYSEKSLKILARKSSLSKNDAHASPKEYISLRRRVLDACEEELNKMVLKGHITPAEVDLILEKLTATALSHITMLSDRYRYGKQDSIGIKGAVLALFDDCFLAFDDNDRKN